MTSATSVRARARAAAADAILDAAEAAFAAHGVDAAAMQTIAQKAGTSVGTLYNYFADRDALVHALLDDRRRRLAESIDRQLAAKAGEPFRAQLDALVRAVLSHFDAHRSFLKIAMEHEPLAKRRSPMTLLKDRLRTLMDTGVREGALDPRRAALAGPALLGILRSILVGEERPSFEALVEDVVEMFLHGAGARR